MLWPSILRIMSWWSWGASEHLIWSPKMADGIWWYPGVGIDVPFWGFGTSPKQISVGDEISPRVGWCEKLAHLPTPWYLIYILCVESPPLFVEFPPNVISTSRSLESQVSIASLFSALIQHILRGPWFVPTPGITSKSTKLSQYVQKNPLPKWIIICNIVSI